MNSEHVEVLLIMWQQCASERRMTEADALHAAIAALSAPAEAQPCGCDEATCTAPWEPGCGLGKSEQHAVVQAQPVAVPTVIVQQGTRVALVEGKPGYERIRCYWELPEGSELFLRPPPSAPVEVEGHEAIAEHCARAVAKLRGRESIHAPTYNAAKRGALTALKTVAALAQQPAAVECPHRTRCDCLCSCKYGMAGDGAIAAQQGGGTDE